MPPHRACSQQSLTKTNLTQAKPTHSMLAPPEADHGPAEVLPGAPAIQPGALPVLPPPARPNRAVWSPGGQARGLSMQGKTCRSASTAAA